MKNSFVGYYHLSQDDFSRLWEDCLFVLDASVLLNLYRYSPETRYGFMGILEQISERLWVSHQAALEFQRNRVGVLEQLASAFAGIKSQLSDSHNQLKNRLSSFVKHPFIDVNILLQKIASVVSEVEVTLKNLEAEYPDLLENDHIRDKITELLDGKVGSPYGLDRLTEIYEQGKARYEMEVPPGYLDSAKAGTRRYGDLVMWLQTIDKAAESKRPIILVSDDRKDDWWLRRKGKTLGPRPELRQEMHDTAGVVFYMYAADPFMEQYRNYLKRPIAQNAIDEVKSVRQEEEKLLMGVDWKRAILDSTSALHSLREYYSPEKATEALRAALLGMNKDVVKANQDALRNISRNMEDNRWAYLAALKALTDNSLRLWLPDSRPEVVGEDYQVSPEPGDPQSGHNDERLGAEGDG